MVNNKQCSKNINMKNSACCSTLISSLQQMTALHLIDLWTATLLSLDMDLTWSVSQQFTHLWYSHNKEIERGQSPRRSMWGVGKVPLELVSCLWNYPPPSCVAGNKSKLSLLEVHLPNSLKPGSTRSLLAPMLKPCTPSWRKCTPAGVW